MVWNYRIVRKPDGVSESGYLYYIHEAYYDKDEKSGELIESGMGLTENAITPMGESVADLRKCLEMMLSDLDKYKDQVIDETEYTPSDSMFAEEDILET